MGRAASAPSSSSRSMTTRRIGAGPCAPSSAPLARAPPQTTAQPAAPSGHAPAQSRPAIRVRLCRSRCTWRRCSDAAPAARSPLRKPRRQRHDQRTTRESTVGLAAEGHVGRTGLYTQYMVGARRGRLCACEEGRLKWFWVCVASAAAARVVAGEAERAVLARGAASGAYARRWRMQVAEHFWPVHAQPLVQPLGWPAVAVAPPLQYESYPQAAAPPCWSIATQPPPAAPYSIAPQPAPTALYGVPLYQLPPYFCSLAPQKPSPPVPPLRIVPQPPPSAHPCSASLQHAPAASAWKMASPCALQQQFETLVM